MKWNYDRGSTETVDFPIEETENVLKAAEKAEKEADLKALQWCIRRLVWLYEMADTSEGGESEKEVRLFNRAWVIELKHDPPPETIKDIITLTQESEPGVGDGV